MTRYQFQLQQPPGGYSNVRLFTDAGATSPAAMGSSLTSTEYPDGKITVVDPYSSRQPSLFGPDGLSTLYQAATSWDGSVVSGSVVVLQGIAKSTSVGPVASISDVPGLPSALAAKAPATNTAEKIVYVSQFGSDSNTGTDPGSALATIGAALTALGSNPGVINIGQGTFTFSTTVGRRNGQRIVGAGTGATVLSYSGTGTAIGHYSPGTGTRIYNSGLSGFTLSSSTGSVGIDLDSTSSSSFHDVAVTSGFSSKSWRLQSATAGGCVYNKFFGCLGAGVTGWSVEATGSNSNNWYGCRASGCTAVGLDITDCNQNTWHGGTFEGCNVAFQVSATTSGLADGNALHGPRFEGNTTNWNITSSNVRETVIFLPLEVTAAGTGTDSGSRSQITAPRSGDKRTSIVGSVASWFMSRIVNASAGIPALHVQDTATGGSDAPTIQASTARATSSFFRGVRGGLTYFDVDASGNLTLPQGGSITIGGAQVGSGSLGQWRPSDNGLMGANEHVNRATATAPALTSGVAVLVKVKMDATGALNNIVAYVQTAGSGLTSGQCFAAVYNSAGTQLGVTADQSTAWASTGVKTMALTAPSSSVNAGDVVYVLFVSNGTTNPALRAIVTPVLHNIGQTAGGTPGLSFATYSTGLTAAPGSLTLSSAVGTGLTVFPWVGVK